VTSVRSLMLSEIAEFVGAELQGDGQCQIRGINTLQSASEGDISFFSNRAYLDHLATTAASAVILHPSLAEHCKAANLLLHENPYLCYARLSKLFDRFPDAVAGVHPSAIVDSTAVVHHAASIGPLAVIEAGVTIREHTVIGASSFIGAISTVGCYCRIAAKVSINYGVKIGDRVHIHGGSVIGADGFGFAQDGVNWVKIYQLGGVEIGNNVEIGACSTVDRGALDNTVLSDGVKLDNHVQIAHNVLVGENTVMAAYVGISGSCIIGKNCVFAGQVGVAGHISICDNVHVTADSVVTKSISRPGTYSSGTALTSNKKWRKNAARFKQLEDIVQRLKRVEKKLP